MEITWKWIIKQKEFYIPASIFFSMFLIGLIGSIILEYL